MLKKAALQVMAQSCSSLSIGSKVKLAPEVFTEIDWLNRAEETRRIAQGVTDPLVKRELIDIASGYERVARLAKDQQAKIGN